MAHNDATLIDPKAAALVSGPPAPDSETTVRWHEGQRRGRLLDGLWRYDLRLALSREFEPRRRRLQGPADVTKNLFRSLISQIAVLYDRPPLVKHDNAAAVDAMDAITSSAGLWQLATQLQQSALGLREAAYRFDVPPGGSPRLLARVVPSYLMWAVATPADPDVPVTAHEYRIRKNPEGKQIWTRDVLSIADPDRPIFRVENAEGTEDLTRQFLPGSLSGDAYPYRRNDGTPILPIVLFHATRTGKMWDPFRGVELVDGTLTIAGLWTQWRHLVRDASWPQRWAVNCVLDGLEPNRETGDMAITTDPATLINFSPKVPGQSTAIGQFAPGGDPRELGNAIRDYAADLAADFDLSPADIQRTHTDPRSGFAIEVSRSGKRSAQRRFEPQFSRGDIQALETIATLWNRATGSELPETGWGIQYRGLPLGIEERKMLMEDHRIRAELGVTSKPRLLAALEGITEDQARVLLLQIQADNAIFASVGEEPPAQNPANNREPEPAPSPAPSPDVNPEPAEA